MANEFDVKIEGLDEIKQKLKGISNDMQYKGGRFALRKAANLIRDDIKQNAQRIDNPDTANDISKNIAVRWSSKSFKQNGDLTFRIGVLGGAKKGGKIHAGGDTFYWRFLEFGTEFIKAQPFIRPAAETASRKVVNEFVNQYNKALDRAIKRANKGK